MADNTQNLYDGGLNIFGTNINGVVTIPGLTGAGGSLIGTPTEIPYFDGNGNTTSDNDFTRDIANDLTVIKTISFNSGLSISGSTGSESITLGLFGSSPTPALSFDLVGGVTILGCGTDSELRLGSRALGHPNILIDLLNETIEFASHTFSVNTSNRFSNIALSITGNDSSAEAQFTVGTFSMNGNVGFSGTYSTGDGTIATVTNGIITNVA
jgi:hypothetical protein